MLSPHAQLTNVTRAYYRLLPDNKVLVRQFAKRKLLIRGHGLSQAFITLSRELARALRKK